MNSEEYEHLVADYFKNKGYSVSISPYIGDYGVDVFASKGNEKIVIQAKMYGETSRPVNRKMFMELYGAMKYFDGTSAKLVTDGRILDDAKDVAKKLGIEIILLKQNSDFKVGVSNKDLFVTIWEKYVLPLQGKTIIRENGKTNKILTVDWSGIKRITSNGNIATIDIEIFKQVIKHLEKYKEITRKEINDDYPGRASSGICLILSQVPFISYEGKPAKLVLKK